MAPITDSQVDDLKDLVHKLEARVWSLERRLEGEKKPSAVETMRMILIGPPGAGELLEHLTFHPTCSLIDVLQERELKLLASRKSTASVTWYFF